MTLAEFNECLDAMAYKTEYIVHIKQKYDHEQEYEEFNTLLLLEDGGATYVWEDDWNEGQQDVQILWFVAVDDIKPSQTQWIPCEERLPKVGEQCLLTVHYVESGGIECNRVIIGVYSDNYKNHILAWMPLPKPYEGRTE